MSLRLFKSWVLRESVLFGFPRESAVLFLDFYAI